MKQKRSSPWRKTTPWVRSFRDVSMRQLLSGTHIFAKGINKCTWRITLFSRVGVLERSWVHLLCIRMVAAACAAQCAQPSIAAPQTHTQYCPCPMIILFLNFSVPLQVIYGFRGMLMDCHDHRSPLGNEPR
jgi:hypothetical protein